MCGAIKRRITSFRASPNLYSGSLLERCGGRKTKVPMTCLLRNKHGVLSCGARMVLLVVVAASTPIHLDKCAFSHGTRASGSRHYSVPTRSCAKELRRLRFVLSHYSLPRKLMTRSLHPFCVSMHTCPEAGESGSMFRACARPLTPPEP